MPATLIRYPGLDLPVHPPDAQVLYTKQDFIEAARGDAPSFLRRIHLYGWPRKDQALTEILKRADESFEEVAAGCGAVVVKHTWGLHRMPREWPGRTGGDWLPEGHILVAEVEVVQPINGSVVDSQPTRAQSSHITKSFLNHQENSKAAGIPSLSDALPHQYAHGVSLEHGLNLHFIDPDLMFCEVEQ
jgi:hypothetical protein